MSVWFQSIQRRREVGVTLGVTTASVVWTLWPLHLGADSKLVSLWFRLGCEVDTMVTGEIQLVYGVEGVERIQTSIV